VRFSPEARTNTGTDNEAEMSALASGWRQAGFDFQEYVLPMTLAQNVEARSTFPGLYSISTGIGGDSIIDSMTSANVPQPTNQWRGSAYDGYVSPELDRLINVFDAALASSDRIRAASDFVRLYTSDLPAISLFFPGTPVVFTSALTGPKPAASESSSSWNIYLWELQ